MKPKMLFLGLGTACAACCAALFLPALLVGAGFVGLAAISPQWIEIGVAAAALGALGTFILWRKRRSSRCAAEVDCGCEANCQLPASREKF